MMPGYDVNGWGWFGMALMMMVAVAIVGLVVSVIARRLGEPQLRGLSVGEQLDARLVQGEIDTKHYRDRLERKGLPAREAQKMVTTTPGSLVDP